MTIWSSHNKLSQVSSDVNTIAYYLSDWWYINCLQNPTKAAGEGKMAHPVKLRLERHPYGPWGLFPHERQFMIVFAQSSKSGQASSEPEDMTSY